MADKYRALTGLSFPDANGKPVTLERGDEVPGYVVARAPWLLEDRGAASANVESIGADPQPGAQAINSPAADQGDKE
jgi:hypothetical protein